MGRVHRHHLGKYYKKVILPFGVGVVLHKCRLLPGVWCTMSLVD